MSSFCGPRRDRFTAVDLFLGLAALSCIAPRVEAADIFWINHSGGNFSTVSNWSDIPLQPDRAPGPNDVAHFSLSDLSSPFQFVYTVSFSTNVTNESLAIGDDFVTFDLNGRTYTTTDTDSSTIEGDGGRFGALTIIDGTWRFEDDVVDPNIVLITIGHFQPGSLTVSTGGVITGLPFIEVGDGNNGTLTIRNGGVVLADRFLISNRGGSNPNGTMTVTGAGSTASAPNGIEVGRVGPGTLNVTAGATVNAAVSVTNLGVLRGDGQIIGNVGSAGVVAPGNTPGTLHINGHYTQVDGGITQIEIGGTTAGSQFDTLDITGRATLDGTLEVSLINGFTPAVNNVFEVIHADLGIFGGFDTLSLPPLPDGRAWAIIYTGLGVFLHVQAATIPGDFNNDGAVDAADYVVWRKTDGSQPGYNTWRQHFGKSAGGGAGADANAAVPEPASLAMLIAGVFGICACYRSRASSWIGRASPLLWLATVVCLPSQVEAADRFWVSTAGGTFSTSSNWQSCGFFCNPVPDGDDVAHFGISSPPSPFQFVYTVNFSANAISNALLLEDDFVTFDLNGNTYTITHSPFSISTQIGNQTGRSGGLTVTDGLLDINSVVFVGASGGNGGVSVTSGGRVQSDFFARFGGPASTANVNISGSTSQWIHAGEMSVGWGGTGTMNITGGGLFQNQKGLIADGAGPGTVTVSGTNSRWINTLDLIVGNGGTATLNIGPGGLVESASGHVSFVAGNTGTVTVNGFNARWVMSGDLFVGDIGSGTLNITGGSSIVANAAAAVGAAVGSSGAVVVSGANSRWVNSSDLNIGHSGIGTLDVSAAGSVNSANAFIGRFAGSQGEVTINSQSVWINSGSLTVGNDGDGTLIVTAGGFVFADNATVGAGAGSTGIATVTGTDATWNIAGTLTVGNFSSNATLDILNGGHVQSVEDATIASSGSASATVDGAGSRWDAAGLLVSLTGSGTLDITDGGVVSGTSGGIGGKSSGVGVVHVDGAGSQWFNSGGLSVGIFGTGTLDITGGAVVENAEGRIGTAGPGEGVVNVTGSGSRWTNSSFLTIGEDGIGTLNIMDGGIVENTEGRIGATDSSSGSGEVNVSGPGSQWINSSLLTISDGADATLNITDGGVVVSNAALTSEDDAYLGLSADATGIVTVSGPGSTWTHHGRFHVGNSGTGELTIEDGGVVSVSGDARIGVENGPLSTVTVTGPGSSWLIGGELAVSDGGIGELAITAGGAVASFDTQIAKENASVGAATVAGAGSTWTISGRLGVGGIADILLSGGTGTLNIQPGGAVNVAQNTVIFDDGLLQLEGGTLDTQAVSFEAGGQFVWTSGTLHVGTFNGDLMNQAGTLAPGHSAGSTTITGTYAQQAGAKLQIEIGGTSPGITHDVVSITSFTGISGQLQLSLLNGFTPGASDTFTVLTAAVGIFGSFGNVANGERLSVLDGLGSFLVHYGPGSAFNPNQVVLSAFEPADLPGDFNLDGIVDTADFVMWQKGLGTTFTQDGFIVWRTNFGETTAGSGAQSAEPLIPPVPEPAPLVLACFALATLVLSGSRNMHRRNENRR